MNWIIKKILGVEDIPPLTEMQKAERVQYAVKLKDALEALYKKERENELNCVREITHKIDWLPQPEDKDMLDFIKTQLTCIEHYFDRFPDEPDYGAPTKKEVKFLIKGLDRFIKANGKLGKMETKKYIKDYCNLRY